MDDEQPTSIDGAEERSADQAELVDGVVVLASVRALEPVREGPPAFVQVAAVAATGFVAGAATAAVLGRHRSRSLARRAPAAALDRWPPRQAPAEALASQRFLVDVYTLTRR